MKILFYYLLLEFYTCIKKANEINRLSLMFETNFRV